MENKKTELRETNTTSKKKLPLKKLLKNSKDYNDTNTDSEVIKIAGISRNSYYKYKAELKQAAWN